MPSTHTNLSGERADEEAERVHVELVVLAAVAVASIDGPEAQERRAVGAHVALQCGLEVAHAVVGDPCKAGCGRGVCGAWKNARRRQGRGAKRASGRDRPQYLLSHGLPTLCVVCGDARSHCSPCVNSVNLGS
eukprot:357613-Chlamydomonas_euryale.AAC.7